MAVLKIGEKELPNIKNIIFDLGGVIVNISYSKTIEAFKKLGIDNIEELFGRLHQNNLFDNYDKGFILPTEFFQGLRDSCGLNLSDADIDGAWNAILLDLPARRIDTILSLKPHFRTFLLSNTNESHLEYFFKRTENEIGLNDFSSIFEKAYYSCRMGMRKPDIGIFLKLIEESKLIPSETLFIDDLPNNIESAKSIGMQTYHISPELDDIAVLISIK